MSSDVTDVWQCDHDITLTLTLDPNKENKRKKEKKRELNKESSVQASHVWHILCWSQYKYELAECLFNIKFSCDPHETLSYT